MTGAPPVLSVVIPLFNEEGNVSQLVARTVPILRSLSAPFELILVDDGSRDRTWERIVEESRAAREVVGCRLSRNFGHQRALLAGLNRAKGVAIVSMDGDLQHPPEVIPRMFADWRAGSKIVVTRRITDQPGSRFKNWASNAFYRVFSSVAETKLEPGTSDFRLLDRQALKELLRLNYGEPFLRGAVQLLGFPTSTVEFAVGARFAGESKYTLRKMLRFARHGLISHSAVPLRLGIWFGLATGVLSILELTYVLAQFALGNTVPGWASTLGLISFLFAVLFITVGIIGLYLEDIHKLLKARPHFIISEMTPRPSAPSPQEFRRADSKELWEEKL